MKVKNFDSVSQIKKEISLFNTGSKMFNIIVIILVYSTKQKLRKIFNVMIFYETKTAPPS